MVRRNALRSWLNRSEVLPDLFYRRIFDGRSTDNLGSPPDMFGDLPECRPILADDDTGFFRLDRSFTVSASKKISVITAVLPVRRILSRNGPFRDLQGW